MSQRITIKDIENQLERLNEMTGHAAEPYSKGADGKFKPNPGNYHLDQAYGGCKIVQMSCTDGCTGVSNVTHGFDTKRDCYEKLCAFIAGVRTEQERTSK